MTRKSTWRANAFHPQIVKPVALTYLVPLVAGALSVLGVPVVREVWYWLFLPALAYHSVMIAGAAKLSTSRQEETPAIVELREAFAGLQFAKGLTSLEDAQAAYLQIRPLLETARGQPSISTSWMAGLVRQTYEQAVSVLTDALVIARVLAETDKDRIRASIHGTEEELQRVAEEVSEERAKALEAQLAASRELQRLVEEQESRLADLLYQCGRCTAALHRARIELAGLQADSSKDAVDTLTLELTATIDRAKKVQAELKHSGGW